MMGCSGRVSHLFQILLSAGVAATNQPLYCPLSQDNPGEPVLSQRTDLLDFYEPVALPAT